ncbi:MAG: ABC transporter ATP-binding protein/permease [Clostridiales bacterium]|jgi:ABC-type multidrug transport system fused ATPase/permease subunit|nr:ABC transporter ATP-binding protein/permease [Clostridiales bacterium]
MKIFFKTVRQNRLKISGFLTAYTLLAAAYSVCGVLTHKFTGDLSQAALDFDVAVFVRFLGVMAAVMGIRALSAALHKFLEGRFSGNTGYKIRENFAKHFTRVRFSDFSKKIGGELLSVHANDLPSAVSFVSENTPNFVSEFLNVVIVFIYMFTIQPVFTLIFFIMFPLLTLLQVKISAPIQKKAAVMSEERARFNAVVNDSLQNIPTVVAYSLEQAMEERYLAAYDKFYAANKSYLQSFLTLIMSGMLASILPLLFIYAAAGYRVAAGAMSVSEFVAFTSVSGVAGSWLAMLSQQMNTLRHNAAASEKLLSHMTGTEENSADEPAAEETLPGGSAANETAVRFNHVSFAYGEDKPVLENVSFSIKKGSRAALVGHSGSGKSTVLKLLLSLYPPSSGDILLYGGNIRHMPVRTLRNQLAYVPQDSFMFPETIRENLGGYPEDKLRAACESAGILEFIEDLPQKFDTLLSEAGENISGGQRQRLAIAHAYLQDAPVVLFDEATSALDPLTEAEILQSFLKMTEGKTVVMVAHRPAAIDACDYIFVLSGGHLIAEGTHAGLMENCPEYKSLYLEEDSHAQAHR